MKRHRATFGLKAAGILISCVLASCAVPVAPTGGPADATPPEILATEPADGSTSFRGTRLRVTFAEYVNEASFTRAFSISPELELPVEVSWRRRTATINFRSPLRENTTYRVTIDKSLRDANGVSLSQPLVFAFSTGPEINRARLVGVVRDGLTGAGAGDMDIYAYAASRDSVDSAPLPPRPLYRTQTNDRGAFELTYLAAGDYFVVGVSDRNTNRMPDEGEWIAVPAKPAATASVASPDSLLLTAFLFDETPPAIRRARAISDSRIEIRYSEPVVFGGSVDAGDAEQPSVADWAVSDSAGTRSYDVLAVYASPADPSTVLLLTAAIDTATAGSTLRLVSAAVADSSGNAVAIDTVFFTATAAADTVFARVQAVRPLPQASDTVGTLTGNEWPVVELGAPRDPAEWLRVLMPAPDGSAREIPFSTKSLDGRSYEVRPELDDPTKPFAVNVDREVLDSVFPGDTTSVYWFRKLRAGELGGLTVYVDGGSEAPLVEYFASDDPSQSGFAAQSGEMTYTVTGLRPGRYGVRAYLDRDGNARWTPGQIRPFRVGEPITWVADSVEVRSRFDTVLPDTLRILQTPDDAEAGE